MREPPGNMPSPPRHNEGRHHDSMRELEEWLTPLVEDAISDEDDPFGFIQAQRLVRSGRHHWQHEHEGTLQAVEALPWGDVYQVTVLALEPGYLPMGMPVAVRLSEMRLVTE